MSKESSDRNLAIEGAAWGLIKARFPRTQISDLSDRGGTTVVRGSNEFFITLDSKSVARVELDGENKFTFTIL